MKYLADVNVLLALVWSNHSDHTRARTWLKKLLPGDTLATCAITELGFLRVSLQTAAGVSIANAIQAIVQLRRARPGHSFLSDATGVDALPNWVSTARQTTDGHLLALAEAHGARLVTFDHGIPGALLIA